MTVLHYDIVGSFLRPKVLKDARSAYENGEIDLEKLRQVEDEQIKDLVEKEIQVGLKVVSDGEFRRSYWHLDTFWGFDGVLHTIPEHGYFFHGEETRADSAQVNGKIKFTPTHPDLAAFKYLSGLVKDKPGITARQSIPAPAQFYAELVRDEENIAKLKEVYQNQTELFDDIIQAYRDLILALYQAGCRDLKLDDCTWGMLSDTELWQKIAGPDFDPESLKVLYLKLNNAVLVDQPADLRLSTHVCRGNYHSTWAAQGGYAPVAKYLLAQELVDAFYLEFDDERSGDFTPLKETAPGKQVVLGLVTSKTPKLESKEVLAKRVKEASQFVPLNKLALSTQCGFASTEEGNILTEQQQWDKIKLVIKTAKEIWD